MLNHSSTHVKMIPGQSTRLETAKAVWASYIPVDPKEAKLLAMKSRDISAVNRW